VRAVGQPPERYTLSVDNSGTWPALRVSPDEASSVLTDRIGIGDQLADEKVVTPNQLQDLLDRAVAWRRENLSELDRILDNTARSEYQAKGWEDFVGAEYSDRYMLTRIRELILDDNIHLSVLRSYVYTPEAQASAPSPSAATARATSQPAASVDVFVSHSSRDTDIADALVGLLRGALNLRSEQIRCTSVPGYKLPHGSVTDAQLRAEILQCRAFIGLITATSVESAYVLFELGARWLADKHLAPLLAAGAREDALHGPLQKYNALGCDTPADVHQFIRDLGLHLGVVPESAAAYQQQLDVLIKASGEAAARSNAASHDVAVEPYSTSRRERILSDDEIIGILQAWFGSRQPTEKVRPIYFDEVDAELGLPAGSTHLHIEEAAGRYRYAVERRGPNLILFRQEQRPAARIRVKGAP
jgi:TIR domain